MAHGYRSEKERKKTEKSGYKFRSSCLCDIYVSDRLLRLETEEYCKAKANTLWNPRSNIETHLNGGQEP